MDSISLTQKAEKAAKRAALISIFFFVCAVLLFASFVGKSRSISGKAEDWANFGDYLAGVLGPIFSLLAFLGILLTIVLQARQIAIQERRASLEEVQRLLSSLAARIDGILDKDISNHFPDPNFHRSNSSVFICLAAGGTGALRHSESDDEQARTKIVVDLNKAALAHDAPTLAIELDSLAWVLGKFKDGGGELQVVEFYKRRYSAVIVWLDSLGYLTSHSEATREFSPQVLKEVFRSRP